MKIMPRGIIVVIALNVLILGGVCYNNVTLEKLPSTVSSQLLNILTKHVIQATKICSDVNKDDIELLLYTRNRLNDPMTLNITNPTDIDVNKKIILLIHGWISGSEGYGIANLKDAYLQRYDCNLILVEWSKLASELYTTSVCSVPKIATILADFLCRLDIQLNVPLSTIHLVGHSLGGQLSGIVGQNTVAKCQKSIGRITGLDPAGPLYQNMPESFRLDRTDAKFVDVIHSNEGVLGYWGNCGDVDFHVNCGLVQLGCQHFKFDIDEINKLPLEVVACDHFRSLDYMAESIASNNFKARPCRDCPFPCIPNSLKYSEIIMGENCCGNYSTGGYLLATHFKAPYGLGSLKLIDTLTRTFDIF